jgi:hypothetical protein
MTRRLSSDLLELRKLKNDADQLWKVCAHVCIRSARVHACLSPWTRRGNVTSAASPAGSGEEQTAIAAEG